MAKVTAPLAWYQEYVHGPQASHLCCRAFRPRSLHGRDTLDYMAIVPLEALRQAIRSAWSADTSATTAWTDSNPSKGQCAVTACVVNDHLGGDILHTTATLPSGDTVSHYFNLIDGRPVDLTSEQFPEHTQFTEPAPKTKGFASTREFCLSYEHTKQRYDLLRARVAEHLND